MPLKDPSTASAMSAAVVDIHLIHRLTNLNEIHKILHETVAKERTIDAELDKLLSKRAELERSFLLLNTPTAETLELVHADCETLLGSVQGTAQLAQHISSKVRRLDLVQTRVQDTLNKINLILDRTNCVNGVQAAMDSEDYEAAANYICTFMDLEQKLSATAQEADAGQLEAQRQVLLDAKAQLGGVIERKLDDAINQRDRDNVLRFAKLYKPLGKQGEGLRRFMEYLKLLVGSHARANYTALSEQLDAHKKIDFVAALTALFKELALALEQHEAFVKEAFGQEALLDVVYGLQVECDTHGSRLVARYLEAQRVDKVVKEATGKRHRAAGAHGVDSSIDPRQVEALLGELLRICQLSEEYNQFMLGKMRQAAGPSGQLSAARETSFRSGQFNVAVRELLGHYMALEEYYMDETASMAIRIDEVDPGALTSSMVDDVFFILRKCGLRALATGSAQCACALLAELNNVLANQYRNALASKLALGPVKLLAAAPGPDQPPGAITAGGDYATALNNSDVSADYVNKLRTELEQYLGEVFAGVGDREKVKSVVADLSKTSNDFRQTNTKALEQLSEALMPKLRPILDEVAAVGYQLTEAEYAANELEETWTHRLLVAIETQVTWLQPLLTTNNYEALFHLVIDKLVARLEALLSRKPFNQLGGLQLDRDTRMLVSHLSEMTTRTVRDKFSRLNQMAIILGLESVEELMDYWGDDLGHITWRLTVAEVRSVLAQRADFSKDSIMALPLQ